MVFTVADKNFNAICKLNKAINIQWIQRWYSCGQFSIQLPANSVVVTDDWYYLICDERENVGIIQQKIYSQNLKGKFLQISGYFMEYELTNVIIEHYILKKAGGLDYAFDFLHRRIGFMIENFISEKDPIFWYEDNLTEFGKYTNSHMQAYDFKINHQDVMSASYELSKNNETSFIYSQDDKTKKLKMLPSVENNKVIFKEAQLENFTVTYDDSNYKNCIKVLGPTLNGEQINYEYITQGEVEKWILLDNTNMSLTDEDNETYLDKSDIEKTLESNAFAELQKYENITNLDIKIANTGKYVYTKDFNIGDIITIQIESLDIEETRQIIEVSEVWKANKHEVYLELGESRQTNIDKTKRAVAQGSISTIKK